MKSLLSFALVALLPVAACAGTTNEPNVDDAAEAVTSLPAFLCSQPVVQRTVPNAPFAQVKAVKSASHDGYDRWVMTFEGSGMPNYRIEREATSKFFDGKGEELALAGNAGISVVVEGASGSDSFAGSKRFKPVGRPANITETALLGDYQGDVGWGIGLKSDACYRVFEISNPPGIVVDVQTNGPAPAALEEPGEPGMDFECEKESIAAHTAHGSFADVSSVRVGSHDGFDRFVMEMAEGSEVPDFEVKKQAAPSFGAITLPGAAGIAVTLSNATGAGTYHGFSRYAGGPSLLEAGLANDSNGSVTWGLGLASATCYRAFKMTSPNRLVVDVKR